MAIRASEVVRPDKENIEALLWESIKDSDDPAFYEEYLERFPDGYFSGIARLKLKEYQGRNVIKETEEKSPTQSDGIASKYRPPLEADDGSDIAVQNERFVSYANGVVRDIRTNLEWLAGPDRAMGWHEAKKWLEKINERGGNWRFPELKEILTIYESGPEGAHMAPPLIMSSYKIWLSNPTVYYFDIQSGTKETINKGVIAIITYCNPLAVRNLNSN